MNYLSVFDRFAGLVFKGLMISSVNVNISSVSILCEVYFTLSTLFSQKLQLSDA